MTHSGIGSPRSSAADQLVLVGPAVVGDVALDDQPFRAPVLQLGQRGAQADDRVGGGRVPGQMDPGRVAEAGLPDVEVGDGGEAAEVRARWLGQRAERRHRTAVQARLVRRRRLQPLDDRRADAGARRGVASVDADRRGRPAMPSGLVGPSVLLARADDQLRGARLEGEHLERGPVPVGRLTA